MSNRGHVLNPLLMLRAYLGRAYPPFVYDDRPELAAVPAFFYHDVRAGELERQLRYLEGNGYHTLTCDAVVERAVRGRATVAGREVLLTFDDGLESLYREAFPLLRKYGLRAVAYIVPAYVGEPGFVSWDQCREMYESSIVDIQSHSFGHARLVTRPVLRGIWLPGSGRLRWEVPGAPAEAEFRRLRAAPLLEGRSLFEAQRALVLPIAFWQDCLRHQNLLGGDGVRIDRAARRRLLKAYRTSLGNHSRATRQMDADAIFDEMVRDLMRSREAIESELGGHTVRHFAFPWHQNGPASWAALEKAGFLSAAIGIGADNGRKPASAARPVEIIRVNGDFLECLPGCGRIPFRRVLIRKTARRIERSRDRRGD